MDLGLGNAVMTGVARTGSGADRQRAVAYVATGFAMLVAVAFIGAAIFALVSAFADWPDLIGVEASAGAEVAPTIAVLFGVLAVNLPLRVAANAQWGLQEGYFDSM